MNANVPFKSVFMKTSYYRPNILVELAIVDQAHIQSQRIIFALSNVFNPVLKL